MKASTYLKALVDAGLPVAGVAIGDYGPFVNQWATEPTPEQEAEAAQIIASIQPIEYQGVLCYSATDVDRASDAAISAALAPGKPGDLQALAREKTLTEAVLAMAQAWLAFDAAHPGVIPPHLINQTQAALMLWADVINPIREAGNKAKEARGWT